jgi:hypothetical protein
LEPCPWAVIRTYFFGNLNDTELSSLLRFSARIEGKSSSSRRPRIEGKSLFPLPEPLMYAGSRGWGFREEQQNIGLMPIFKSSRGGAEAVQRTFEGAVSTNPPKVPSARLLGSCHRRAPPESMRAEGESRDFYKSTTIP